MGMSLKGVRHSIEGTARTFSLDSKSVALAPPKNVIPAKAGTHSQFNLPQPMLWMVRVAASAVPESRLLREPMGPGFRRDDN